MLSGPFLEKNFIGSTDDFDNSRIVMLGMPFDGTCTNRPGARFAPQQIRVESVGIEEYSAYFNTNLSDLMFYDAGELEFPFGDTKKTLEIIEKNTDEIYLQNKKILGIGGEHLVTLGTIKGVLKHINNLAVVHFDAHTDLREQYLGVELTHSGVMLQIAKLVGFENIMQIGIRSGEKQEFELMQKYSTRAYVPSELSRFKDKNIFVTIDLDVLDPSLMSGTGTPEAGGLTYTELMRWILELKNYKIIGADIVELAPDLDITKVSTATACKLIREVLNIL